MARRQRHELLAPAVEERIGADEERAGLQLDEGGEGGVDLAFGAGLQDMELHPLRARRFLHVSHHALGTRIVRVHQQGDHAGLGNQLGKQLQPLGHQLGDRMLKPVRLPPGRARLATRPAATGSLPTMKTIGIVEVAFFAASAEGVAAARHDHVDLAADEIGGQCGQPIIATLRPAVFDRHILSLDIAGFAQSLAERGERRSRSGRAAAEVADHRHRLLLRAEGARPPSSRRLAGASARAASFDDLVGAGEDRWRDLRPRAVRRLEVDHQLELGRLLGRQSRRAVPPLASCRSSAASMA